jgi:hypothetical protein
MFAILASLIGPDKIGGWVRSGVAALLAMVIAKFPGLADVLDPATQAAIGVAVAALVVGIWQHLTKTDAAAVSKVAALASDPSSPVRPVVVDATQAGREMVRDNPGGGVVIAGTAAASAVANKPTLTAGAA